MTQDSTLAFAHQLADAARSVVVPYFGTRLEMVRKEDDSPVTCADREAERRMRDLITTTYPEHGILGEEFGEEGADRKNVWVLDPIDGTKSFITGRPLFGTLVALTCDGVPVLGVADMPILDRRWSALAGEQSFNDGVPCATSGLENLADARLACTSIDMFDEAGRESFEALSRKVWFCSFGGDLYIYLMVASGHVDVVVEGDVQPYDVLALVPIIEGAGGVITDWSGAPVTRANDGRIVAAATPRLHEQALESLR
jgi:inositol-phosphate phosphatase / L-galactose 1-phosphate phosphatase / histidinol-phosphatase